MRLIFRFYFHLVVYGRATKRHALTSISHNIWNSMDAFFGKRYTVAFSHALVQSRLHCLGFHKNSCPVRGPIAKYCWKPLVNLDFIIQRPDILKMHSNCINVMFPIQCLLFTLKFIDYSGSEFLSFFYKICVSDISQKSRNKVLLFLFA